MPEPLASPAPDTTIVVRYTRTADLKHDYLSYISHCGYVVETDAPPKLWDTVRVEFFLPNDDAPIGVRGKVVRILPDPAQCPDTREIVFTVCLELVDLDARRRSRFDQALGYELAPLDPDSVESIRVHNFDEVVRELVPETTLEYRFASWKELYDKYHSDLAKGGINIRATRPIPVNTPVDVRLIPPDGTPPLELSGTVVHHVAAGARSFARLDSMDVVFENLSQAQECLRAYVMGGLERAAAPA